MSPRRACVVGEGIRQAAQISADRKWWRGERGKRLSEKDIAKLMPTFRHHDVIFEVAAIDPRDSHRGKRIRRNQARRAQGMTANLGEEHHQTMVDAIWKARRELRIRTASSSISRARSIFELVRTVIEHTA